MPMTVHFQDHTNTPKQVDIDDRTYDEGPGDDMWDFAFKTSAEKGQAWQDWLGLKTSNLDALKTSRQVLRDVWDNMCRVQRTQHYGSAAMREVLLDPVAQPGAGTPLQERRRVPVAMWDRGPTNEFGAPLDFNFNTNAPTDALKEQRWKDFFAANPNANLFVDSSNVIYGRHGVITLDGYTRRPAEGRCLDALKFTSWNKAKWATIFGTLGSVVTVLGWFAIAGGQATKVLKAVMWAAAGKSTVTITWTPLLSTAPTNYSVTLAATDATGPKFDPLIVAVSDTQGAVAVFVDVPDGDYVATVTVFDGLGTSGPGTSIDVSVARPTSTGGPVPDAPTAVTIENLTMTVQDQAGVTVRWVAPIEPVTGYTVTLTSTAPVGDPVVKQAGNALSLAIPNLPAATYSASVTATNDSGTSVPGVSTMPFVLTISMIPGPDAPRNARIVPYKAESTGKAGLLVRWDPPTTGSTVRSYRVVKNGREATESAQSWVTFPALADGAYAFTVQSKGPGGLSAVMPVNTTLAANAIPADAIDWELFFSPDDIKKWKTANNQLDSMTETAFWTEVLNAVADTNNQYGGAASYAEQLLLGRVLETWIELPAGNLSVADRDKLADRLCAVTVPPFPTTAPMNGRAYTDPVALWKAASTLKQQMNPRADEVLRHKVIAVVRALERYLAPVSSRERLYSSDVIPTASRDTPGRAVQTAQRISFANAGQVNGVWWYRTTKDTGTNTVLCWRGQSELARTSGDPGMSGWVYLAFATPVPVTKGDRLLVGVHHPSGSTAVRDNGFAMNGLTVGNLSTPRDRDIATPKGPGNGLYDYSPTPVRPTTAYLSSEYFITPDFTAS